ncbi:hypothetical protein [Chamaesiphon minutus]|nr:hypothetical protein [Chamaesiphon minutus]
MLTQVGRWTGEHLPIANYRLLFGLPEQIIAEDLAPSFDHRLNVDRF